MQFTNLTLGYIYLDATMTPTKKLALKDEQRLSGITGTRALLEFCIFVECRPTSRWWKAWSTIIAVLKAALMI